MNILSLTNTDGVIPYSERGNQGNKSKENLEDYKVVYPNTIVANSMNILIGSVGLSKYEGCVSPVYYVYSAKSQIDIRYMNYLFQTEPFQKRLRQFANGILEIRLRVSSHDILHQKVAVPDYDEQQVIADYLDETCSQINEIIEEVKASIDEYKELKQAVIFEAVTKGLDKNVEMKESTIENLESIPSNWEIRRIATLYEESKETGREDLPILMVSINTGISEGEVGDDDRIRKVVRSEDKSVYKVVHRNDLAYNMMRAWQGGFGAAQVEGLVSPAYVVARPKCELDSRYVEALLRTPIFTEKIRGLSYGVADFRLRLYWTYFKNLRICFPPLEEQRQIADFITAESKKLDALIHEKLELVVELEAYKKSLIYEVVTGKRRVV
nr:restriction endonuclease subunit S [Bilifractor porci]